MAPSCSQCDSSHDREDCPYRWINDKENTNA